MGRPSRPLTGTVSRAVQFQTEGRYAEALAEYTAVPDELERRLGPEDIARRNDLSGRIRRAVNRYLAEI